MPKKEQLNYSGYVLEFKTKNLFLSKKNFLTTKRSQNIWVFKTQEECMTYLRALPEEAKTMLTVQQWPNPKTSK